MSTWNVVLGSDSTTTPSTSIMSDFAKLLSLPILITAAECGYGFTKLTVCDFFVTSDFFSYDAVALSDKDNVFHALALGRLDPPTLPVGQQQEILLRGKHEE